LQPGYICEAKGRRSNIFDNSSAAITTLYQELFGSKTKFSGPLIMGHDKMEINEQLLKDIHFRPFNCKLEKFQLFIYGIGVSFDNQMYDVGPGFKSSFYYSIGKEKKRTLVVQEITEKNSSVKMYQDYELVSTYIGNNPNEVWQKIKKIDVFKDYEGVYLFGITHSQVQSLIKTMHIPKCQPKEWNDFDKMQTLWNYHLKKYTSSSILWHEFFIKWQNEKKTVIEITDALKNLYPQNHVFNIREMRAWRAMLSH